MPQANWSRLVLQRLSENGYGVVLNCSEIIRMHYAGELSDYVQYEKMKDAITEGGAAAVQWLKDFLTSLGKAYAQSGPNIKK